MTITTEEAEECARGQDSIKESSQFPGYRSIACRAAATIRSLVAERDALQARVAELEGLGKALATERNQLIGVLQADEITRLRAAINDALTAPWPDPELNSTRHQEPIGPNETPEEAIKRLVSVRAEWAVCENDRNNPVIADLRAELATARREGMEKAAQIGDRHIEIGEVLAETETDKRLADNIKMQVGAMKQVVGAIRAAAGEGK